MQRRHQMPFGTRILDHGRVRFRLWAPGAERVSLCLQGYAPETELHMAAEDDGWFGIITELAAPDSLYQFRIDDDLHVPDPASRYQPVDVHGSSQVIDPEEFQWQDGDWRGRPWHETVLYECHVGTFTPEGTFAGVEARLDHLVALGVTALELMPVADFPGRHNWGYDGVLPFAPDSRYGHPEDLKRLVQAAHARGLMVFLDVVYNHFGPEGNYLHAYAPQFFTERHHTPWGAAINFDGEGSRWVRQYFIENALYWLDEYHLDGLRLDAVHAILDDSSPDFLTDLATAVHQGPGRQRHIHLVLENDRNQARYLERDQQGRPRWYVAQWNDDLHHALHVLATGESMGYYADYRDTPVAHLGRCLSEGFAYQGDPSSFREGEPRGEPSGHLPPTAFVGFIQNHDQVGNRAFGERLSLISEPAARWALAAVYLLAPQPPLLFMGEEWDARQPFPFFCDFGEDLAPEVKAGRRREFAKFPEFADPQAQERIPDPGAEATFHQAQLDWQALERAEHAQWFADYQALLALRRKEIVPRLSHTGEAGFSVIGERGLWVGWPLGEGSQLMLVANLGTAPLAGVNLPSSARCLYATQPEVLSGPQADLPGWFVAWFVAEENGG